MKNIRVHVYVSILINIILRHIFTRYYTPFFFYLLLLFSIAVIIRTLLHFQQNSECKRRPFNVLYHAVIYDALLGTKSDHLRMKKKVLKWIIYLLHELQTNVQLSSVLTNGKTRKPSPRFIRILYDGLRCEIAN